MLVGVEPRHSSVPPTRKETRRVHEPHRRPPPPSRGPAAVSRWPCQVRRKVPEHSCQREASSLRAVRAQPRPRRPSRRAPLEPGGPPWPRQATRVSPSRSRGLGTRSRSGTTVCEVGASCGAEQAYVTCDSLGEEVQCWCDSGRGNLQVELSGSTLDGACHRVAALCLDSTAPLFEQELACVVRGQGISEDACSSLHECSQTGELAAGVTAQSQSYESTACERSNGSWGCTRDGAAGPGISFEMESDRPASALCPTYFEACRSEAPFADLGDRRCRPVSEGVGGNRCDSRNECTRDATLNGRPVLLREPLDVSCEQGEDLSWSCGCYFLGDHLSFGLPMGDAWATCEDAATRCVAAQDREVTISPLDSGR